MNQQSLSRRRAGLFWTCLIIGALLFGVMAVWQRGEAPAFDVILPKRVSAWHTPVLTVIVKGITLPGEPWFLTALCLVVLAVARPRRRGILFAANGLLVGGLNNLLKALFARPRPDAAQRLLEVSGHSFPSGHAMASTAIYGLLICAVWHTGWPPRRKGLVTALLSLLILLIGFSRVYLRVHYPSDVLGGIGAGLAWLALFLPAAEKLARAWDEKRPQ